MCGVRIVKLLLNVIKNKNKSVVIIFVIGDLLHGYSLVSRSFGGLLGDVLFVVWLLQVFGHDTLLSYSFTICLFYLLPIRVTVSSLTPSVFCLIPLTHLSRHYGHA